MIKKEQANWKKEIKDNYRGIIFSILFFIFAGIANYFAGKFVDSQEGAIVPDIILSNIPTFNLENLFVIGIFSFIALFLFYPLIFKPKYFPIALSQLALFVLIRNFFIILTRLQLPEDHLKITFPFLINHWNFTKDLFFSGHVAVPFLGYLIFKESKIRWWFLFGSFFMGTVALMTKLHYSIDVFSAFFIGYAIFELGNWIFTKKTFKFIKIPYIK